MRKTKTFSAETNVDSPKWLSEEVNIINICETTISSFSSQAIPSVASGNNIVSILLTDDEKMSGLNKMYRNKVGTTNVLSFTNENKHSYSNKNILLGDIALSFTTILRESNQFKISFINHVKHLLIHGCLHLLGFDHETAIEAQEMEALEVSILGKLGVPNPYNI
ncbi:MAG: hypothetical protein CM15mP62_02350 [Rhodospirillaceae bacterium]|nr:MAG: hypothetical protein CM15mP62_02350 [Rhodospirillaceae bacterium]